MVGVREHGRVIVGVCRVTGHVGYHGLALPTTHVIARMSRRLVKLIVLPSLLLLARLLQLDVNVHILH